MVGLIQRKSLGVLQERQNPPGLCSVATQLRFDGRFLNLKSTSFIGAYTARSGKLSGDFSIKAQKDRGLGPIPEGTYWIFPAQIWTRSPIENWLADHTQFGALLWAGWGHHRITIHEMPDTQTYGRGGFFLHGGLHPGSSGCIHITGTGDSEMDRFLADLQKTAGGFPACAILLKVAYPK
jgi:hypothetical protein